MKTKLKKTLKYTPVLILVWYLILFTFSGPRHLNPIPVETNITQNIEIGLVKYGWHVGIVIPIELLKNKYKSIGKRFPKAKYLELGWGDKGFYQSKEISPLTYINAIAIPSTSIMHVVSIESELDPFLGDRTSEKLCINEIQSQNLTTFIESSFRLNEDEVITGDHGIYGDSQFYEANGYYNLTYTCNRWIATALSTIGIKTITSTKLTSDSVMKIIKDLKKENGYDKYECSK